MTSTECKYAQIEKEALAVTWASERSSNYIVGKPIAIEMDYKPVVPLLMKQTIDTLPPRLQRYKMRLMQFNIKAVNHVPGRYHYTADTMSRKLANPNTVPPTIPEEMKAHIDSIIAAFPASDRKLSQIIAAQDQDKVCKQVKRYCSAHWHNKNHIEQDIKPYYQANGEITVVHGLLMRGTRIVIPKCLQQETLQRVHEGHQGINKCRARTNQSVWWLGISAQITTFVQNCQSCSETSTCRPNETNATSPMAVANDRI